MAGPEDEHDSILDNKREAETKSCVGGGGERDMAPSASGTSIHRSGSRPQLDLSKAEIQGNLEERDPTILLPNQSDDISHLALDIGGSLIKLLYFSRHEDYSNDDDKRKKTIKERLGITNGNLRSSSCQSMGCSSINRSSPSFSFLIRLCKLNINSSRSRCLLLVAITLDISNNQVLLQPRALQSASLAAQQDL